MLDTKPVIIPLLAVAFCLVGLAAASPVQGGWRQWEVRLRDGRRLEANPLGAPDNGHLSLSVGAYDRREHRIARALVQVVAAEARPGESLPALPTVSLCEDAIILRDGTTTIGRISLARVRWSEGVVVQRGDTVGLRDVAYLVFAARNPESGRCRHEGTRHQLDVTHPGRYPGSSGIPFPVGSWQWPMQCADDCRP